MTVESIVKSPMLQRTVPPCRGSISEWPRNHESIPGPVAIASQTCSGVASTSMSCAISNACAMTPLMISAADEIPTRTAPRHEGCGARREG